MNNFDDLFEQQPQPEATEKPEPQKEKPKKQWWQIREEKQRKEAYATLDRVFGAFSEGHGDMKAYLDTQSRFPFHSARNAILIGEQCPNAKRVGGYKEWASQGVEILEEEKRLPIIILEPGKAYRREDGSVGQNFYAKEVFDISQTTARDEAQPQVSYDDRLLLKALISNSPVPIRAVEELPGQGRGAMFDPEQNAILVKKGMDAPDIFRCVSLELANAQLARSNAEYSRETEGYKAYAVSYMLCQRYGVEAGGYNISRLDGVLQGQDPKEEIPAALTDMRDTFKEINGRMARAMGLSRAGRQKEQERYIDAGVIPKFAACASQGVPWFKERGLWQDNSYEPRPGDIIFFDWDDGGQDGSSDHVGIVEKVENGRVYTVEGNSGDSVRQNSYPVGYYEIYGYGTPAY